MKKEVTITVSGPMASGKSWLSMLIGDMLSGLDVENVVVDEDMNAGHIAQRRQWLKDSEKRENIMRALRGCKVTVRQQQVKRSS